MSNDELTALIVTGHPKFHRVHVNTRINREQCPQRVATRSFTTSLLSPNLKISPPRSTRPPPQLPSKERAFKPTRRRRFSTSHEFHGVHCLHGTKAWGNRRKKRKPVASFEPSPKNRRERGTAARVLINRDTRRLTTTTLLLYVRLNACQPNRNAYREKAGSQERA